MYQIIHYWIFSPCQWELREGRVKVLLIKVSCEKSCQEHLTLYQLHTGIQRFWPIFNKDQNGKRSLKSNHLILGCYFLWLQSLSLFILHCIGDSKTEFCIRKDWKYSGKRRNVGNQHFSPFPTSFQKASVFSHDHEAFTTQSKVFTTLDRMAFENKVAKEENAGYQHFLLFLQFFSNLSNATPGAKLAPPRGSLVWT